MGLFFPSENYSPDAKLTGFALYRDVLERDWVHFMFGGLITTAAYFPFLFFMLYALLSTSFLAALAGGLIGGALFGPFLYAFLDGLFRSLRDARGKSWMHRYFTVLKKEWKHALVPGMILGLFLGAIAFAGVMMFIWAQARPGWFTLLFFCLSILFASMIYLSYWPQLVLFDQKNSIRLKNCLLFVVKYFSKTLKAALIQTVFWGVAALLLPWSALVLPIAGLWLVSFFSFFVLYPALNEAYGLEKAIEKEHPEQVRRPTKDLDFRLAD